ncbi:TetR/AcrR family transcriptional regulator [Salinactinospora qingdaonensis]|uniref:TetR/AcrR family transcriptional regulator n=1 Tax=Salinactinospora qingdaonensis TaxID=702744 RepID=A0ABP7FSF9_9ACTN
MSTGLRQRNRLAAMRLIQETALDLFDERGFDSVTIEEVAAAAEVSPSTVYRYFGTKEGLIVSDEFDSLSEEALADLIDLRDIVGTARRIVASYESSVESTSATQRSEHGPWRRVRYFFQEPSVRSAIYASLDRASARIAENMMTQEALPPTQARVAAHAIVFGYFAALEQWHLDGAERPISEYVDQGLSVLWGPPPPAGE